MIGMQPWMLVKELVRGWGLGAMLRPISRVCLAVCLSRNNCNQPAEWKYVIPQKLSRKNPRFAGPQLYTFRLRDADYHRLLITFRSFHAIKCEVVLTELSSLIRLKVLWSIKPQPALRIVSSTSQLLQGACLARLDKGAIRCVCSCQITTPFSPEAQTLWCSVWKRRVNILHR